MPLSPAAAKALGKLFRNLTNPRWLSKEATGTATSIVVLNWAEEKVKAFYKGVIQHSPDRTNVPVHVGDVYHCDDGHNYVYTDGKKFRYDEESDAWYNA